MLYWSLNLTECLFQEPKKEKFIKELLEDSRKIGEKVDKRTDAVLSLIELVIVCCTHYLEEH
jgi:hypothetical protein